MTEPVKIVTFGGAKFDANQVASQSTTKKNGKTYYVVNFKSGAKVQYPTQPKKNEARIHVELGAGRTYAGYSGDSKEMAHIYDNMGKAGYTNFTGGEGVVQEKADKYTISQFWGLEFSGSKKADDVNLKGCTRCTVDIRGGNSASRDEVRLVDSPKYRSQNNEVIMDAKDYTAEIDAKNNWINRDAQGEGIHHEGDSIDELK